MTFFWDITCFKDLIFLLVRFIFSFSQVGKVQSLNEYKETQHISLSESPLRCLYAKGQRDHIEMPHKQCDVSLLQQNVSRVYSIGFLSGL